MKLLFTLSKDFEAMGKFKFVDLSSPKLFQVYEKNSTGSVFNLGFIENILDLVGLKGELKSVYAADIVKQSSSIQEIIEIIWELELNQLLAEVTKLLRLILTIPATSASCEISSSSLKYIDNFTTCLLKWREIK